MITLNYAIAGIIFSFQSDAELPHLTTSSFPKFAVDDSRPDVLCRVREVSPDSFLLPELDEAERHSLLGTVGFKPSWASHRAFRTPVVRERLHWALLQPQSTHVDINWNGLYLRDYAHSTFDLFYPPEQRARLLGPLMAASVRNWVSSFLPGFSAVPVHAAGVVRPSGTAVFLAPDDGGKTTVARLAPPESVLSDDHIILRQEGAVMAHAAPLGHMSSGPRSAPVRAFFKIEKATEFQIRPIESFEILAFLWREYEHRLRFLPKSLRTRSYEVFAAATRQAPGYVVRCRKGMVDWDAIDQAMTRSYPG